MRRALISVSDKTGIVEIAKELIELGIEIISTGGTYKLLADAGVDVLSIEEVTHFPEMLDGRVKTLHPNIHGGLLFRRKDKHHVEAIKKQHISPIDFVIVNLYPFVETIKKENCSLEHAIENIDIGGPSMLRSAAKNHEDVTVVCDLKDAAEMIRQLKEEGETSLDFRRFLAAKVFRLTAAYDAMIAEYLTEEDFPERITHTYTKVADLRYGENPHQKAAFYKTNLQEPSSLSACDQLQGKELSYNNIQDANAALAILSEFDAPCCVAVKHTNPCGVAIAENHVLAWQKAYQADPVSIFGGIVAFNGEVNEAIAQGLSELFLEVILAPKFTLKALEILSLKKNVRVLVTSDDFDRPYSMTCARVSGGLLVQTTDTVELDKEDCKVVCGNVNDSDWDDLLFGEKVCKHVKSNAIVIVKDGMTVGIGGGQSNRVGAAKIALEQAGEKANGAIMASDAFFPMPDTVELAAQYGVKAIIQPGGSIKDELSIEACKKHNIAMVLTGVRHFKHG
jgi:phosphoribosylaminoimidazolecarboxamide formyltransferase / IMP cyclohydrolase